MNRKHSTLPLALWAALALNAPGSVTGTETGHREHGAHAHGHGVLEVVAEDDVLAISLRVPAVNVVGFEHAPSTEAQHHAVEDAIARFRLGERLFAAPAAAGCRLEDADVALGGMEGEHDEAHKNDEHDEHAKDEHEDHDEHAKGEHDEEAHSELHAEYRFRCADPERLDAIQVRLFDALNDVEALDARVVTETFQGAAEVTAGSPTLKLAR